MPTIGPSTRANICSTHHGSAIARSKSVAASCGSPSVSTSSLKRSGCASSAGTRNGEIQSVRSGGTRPGVSLPSSAIRSSADAGPTRMRKVRPECEASRLRAHASRSSARLARARPGFMAWRTLSLSGSIGTPALEHVASMQGDDATGKIEPLDALEARLLHHAFQRRLVGMHTDRLGEVAVTGLVVRDQFSQPREDIEAVPIVRGLERRPYLTEFQDDRDAAGPEHAPHFGKRNFLASDVAQPEADAHAIEEAVVERQCFGIALHGGNEPAIVDHAIAAGCEHRPVDVGKNDLSGGSDALGEQTREVGCSARDVG